MLFCCAGAPYFLCLLGGAAIGSSKNRQFEGFLWALLFGPLGLLIIACMPYSFSYFCPECETGLRKNARRCPACGTRFRNTTS